MAQAVIDDLERIREATIPAGVNVDITRNDGAKAEDAVNTHPDMVRAVISECLRVGAQEVVALSHDGMRSMRVPG